MKIDRIVGTRRPHKFYWCDECHRFVEVNTLDTMKLTFDIDPEDDDLVFEGMDIDLSIRCTKCDAYMINLDPRMAKYIITMNKNCLRTAFCCDGHLEIQSPILKGDEVGFGLEIPYICIYYDGLKEYHDIRNIVHSFGYEDVVEIPNCGNEYIGIYGKNVEIINFFNGNLTSSLRYDNERYTKIDKMLARTRNRFFEVLNAICKHFDIEVEDEELHKR